jgi:hypothetical protein
MISKSGKSESDFPGKMALTCTFGWPGDNRTALSTPECHLLDHLERRSGQQSCNRAPRLSQADFVAPEPESSPCRQNPADERWSATCLDYPIALRPNVTQLGFGRPLGPTASQSGTAARSQRGPCDKRGQCACQPCDTRGSIVTGPILLPPNQSPSWTRRFRRPRHLVTIGARLSQAAQMERSTTDGRAEEVITPHTEAWLRP